MMNNVQKHKIFILLVSCKTTRNGFYFVTNVPSKEHVPLATTTG